MSDINKALDQFEKAVDISFAGGIPLSLLARQDLEAAIVKLTYRETPLRDILKRIKGDGRSHLWNVRKSLGGTPAELTTQIFYADGDVPKFSDPAYTQVSAPYKYLGIAANITGPMIASGRSFTDIEAEVAEAKLRQVIQAEEWALFNGDSSQPGQDSQGNTIYPQFDGLGIQIKTNVIDKLGAAIDIQDIWRAIKLIRLQGGQPTHVFTSYGIQNQLNTLLLGDIRYIASAGTTVTMGLNANNIQTPAGVLPLIGDFFINPATPYPIGQNVNSSGPEGATTSDVYVLCAPEIEVADLLPIGRTELAKIADSVRFYINEYSILCVNTLRHIAVRLYEKIGYIGETLGIKKIAETIPTEVYALCV